MQVEEHRWGTEWVPNGGGRVRTRVTVPHHSDRISLMGWGLAGVARLDPQSARQIARALLAAADRADEDRAREDAAWDENARRDRQR